ncbi:MAG: STAS domain-containing protein [Pseudomonadales bacterium]
MVGDHDGVYVLLFEGDVRLTLCTAVDSFLDRMFQDAGFQSVVVDLAATQTIDSTSLGLLAKLSIQADKRFGFRPTLVSTRPDITRVLVTMGLDDVFNLVEQPLVHDEQLGELACASASEDEVRERVLEAHRILMSMNETNRSAFSDLVTTLEADCQPTEIRRRASL